MLYAAIALAVFAMWFAVVAYGRGYEPQNEM